MAIDFENTELTELTPKIAVVGVGGAGCNAVNNMIAADLQGVDFIIANTDAQALANSTAGNRIQLGVKITQGLGSGAQPKIGAAAAEEAIDAVDQMLDGVHMAFVTAGMGGGTGTGAAPVIAKRARERGILTVGVVTKPFQFEGGRRMKLAEAGILELAGNVDTLIVIPNQNLFRVANEKTTFADAFAMADDVLHSGVRSITDLMVMPGLINLDFADVRTVMSEMGKAMMGTGESNGEGRAVEAAAAAISNPLLEEASLAGAKGVIINVTGGMDMTLYEVDEAVNMVREQVDEDALIVFGSAFNPESDGTLRVSVVATGIICEHPNICHGAGASTIPTPSVTSRKVEISVEETAEISTDDGGITAAADTEVTSESVEANAETVEEANNAADDIEQQAVAAQGDSAFVADEPKEPKVSISSIKPANVFQEAAYENTVHEEVKGDDSQPTTASKNVSSESAKKKSLFQLMTAGLRGGATDPAMADKVVAKPVSNDDVVVKQPEVKSEPRREASVTETAGAESAPAPKADASLGGVSSDDRLSAPKPAPKDQLEIPSFLRRQGN